MLSRLKRSTKRLLALLVLLPAAVLLLGTLYMLGMNHLEESPRTFLQGIQWAVAGQILAYHLLVEQVSHVENRIKFSRVTAGDLAGAHPWRSPALERTGAKVIAVERAGDLLVGFDNGFAVRPDDVLFVCGCAHCFSIPPTNSFSVPPVCGRSASRTGLNAPTSMSIHPGARLRVALAAALQSRR